MQPDADPQSLDRQVASVPLRQAMPELYSEALAEYRALLGSLVEARVHPNAEATGRGKRCLDLARRLHGVDAGPRDVIELHTAAVRLVLASASPSRSPLYVEEARVLAIELMGNLAGLFRNDYLCGAAGLVRRGALGAGWQS